MAAERLPVTKLFKRQALMCHSCKHAKRHVNTGPRIIGCYRGVAVPSLAKGTNSPFCGQWEDSKK